MRLKLTEEERRARKAANAKRWRELNPEAAKASKQKYYASEKGRLQKKKEDLAYKTSGKKAISEEKRKLKPLSDARKAARLKWAKNNQSYFTAMRAYRRSLEKALNPFEFWVLQEAVELARLREKIVGGKWHVDHIIPVSKGGNSNPNNLQVVPAIWNQQKSNVHAERFIGCLRRDHG